MIDLLGCLCFLLGFLVVFFGSLAHDLYKKLKKAGYVYYLMQEELAQKQYAIAKATGLSDLDAYRIYYKYQMENIEAHRHNPYVKIHVAEIKRALVDHLDVLLANDHKEPVNSFLRRS